MMTKRQLKKDLEFMLDRTRWPNADVGVSSTALVRFAYLGVVPEWHDLPRDEADFNRCLRTRQALPKHRQTPEVDALMLRYLAASFNGEEPRA